MVVLVSKIFVVVFMVIRFDFICFVCSIMFFFVVLIKVDVLVMFIEFINFLVMMSFNIICLYLDY